MRVSGRPRLALLANTVDAEYGLRAGGHLHFIELSALFEQHGYEVRIFAPSFVAAELRARCPGIRVVAMPSLRRVTSSKLVMFAYTLVSWCARVPELRACDVVYCSSHFLGDTIPGLATRGRRSAVVMHHLLGPPSERPGNRIVNLIAYVTERTSVALIKRFAGAVIAGNPMLARELRARGFEQYLVSTGNGARPIAATAPIDRRGRHVAFVGRLSPTKGVPDLLRAWRGVIDTVPDAFLTLVGNGTPNAREELRAMTIELGIAERVRFLYEADDAAKYAVLQSSGIFAFPSHEEGWGIALAEAMACGLPCITYDLPVYREIFTVGRIAVTTGDTRALGDAIVALCEDDDERARLGRDALRLSASFTWDAFAETETRAIDAARAAGTPTKERLAR